MATEIREIESEFWHRGRLRENAAFTEPDHAVSYVLSRLKTIDKYKKFMMKLIRTIRSHDKISMVGRQVPVREHKGEAVALLPDGKLLVLVSRSRIPKERKSRRSGFLFDVFTGETSSKKPIDISKYWRTDDKLRESRSVFASSVDVFRYVRTEIRGFRESRSPSKAVDEVLVDVRHTLEAVEHDFFQLIGDKITTNERRRDAERGPLPSEGELVAILPGGKGLVELDEDFGAKHGFLAGRTKLAQILRGNKKRTRRNGKKTE